MQCTVLPHVVCVYHTPARAVQCTSFACHITYTHSRRKAFLQWAVASCTVGSRSSVAVAALCYVLITLSAMFATAPTPWKKQSLAGRLTRTWGLVKSLRTCATSMRRQCARTSCRCRTECLRWVSVQASRDEENECVVEVTRPWT